jgi:hypothetical protein
MAAERLRELRRLPVADAVGDLADREHPRGEQLGRAVHPHPGQVVAERGVADLGVGALELAPGRGDAARDVVEREVGRVVARGAGWSMVAAWGLSSYAPYFPIGSRFQSCLQPLG